MPLSLPFGSLCLLVVLTPSHIATAAIQAVSAPAALTARQVVQAHAKAWSTGDLPGLLALFHDDARSYDRSPDPHKLNGKLSSSIGTKDQLETYFKKAYAVQSPSRESISWMAAVRDLVIAAGGSEQPPDFASRMRFLTAYRVGGGRIHDLWHIAWLPAEAPSGSGPAEVIQQLNAARMAGDADRFLALFAPDAKHFCTSGDPRTLADRLCDGSSQAADREAFLRSHSSRAPLRIDVVALFSVGDLVVQQSRVTGLAGRWEEAIDQVSIYRVRDGRIVDTWLLGEEIHAVAALESA